MTAMNAAIMPTWSIVIAMADASLADAIRASAGNLGIDPSDLATAISYETGGKFDPSQYGGAGGKYLGLIQFGPEEQAKYGVKPDQSAPDQMGAVEGFLRDRGVKPGMGLLDIYSTINAGRPGLYNRSDAANGGAPGTVSDKVAGMYPHRLRANALLGTAGDPSQPAPVASAAPPVASSAAPGAAPVDPNAAAAAPAASGPSPQTLAALQAIPGMLEQQSKMAPSPPMDVLNADPVGIARARAFARAMAQRPLA